MPHEMNQSLNICSLISIGEHPDTGRARRAPTDARAVELAMTLGQQFLNSHVEVLHAGDPDEPALGYYSGMGLPSLRVLRQRREDDALMTISHYFRDNIPDIVLTGLRAESGESSGMLPFFLAKQLQCPVVMGIVEILSIEEGKAKVLQALPRGQRRALNVPLPFVASVDMAASEPRQSAFGRARLCQIQTEVIDGLSIDQSRLSWEISPAKPKAKRLKVVKATNAADRFKAATAKAAPSGGKVLKDQPVSEMAQAVFDLLLEEEVIR